MKKTILIIAFLTGCLCMTAQCHCDSLREIKILCQLGYIFPKKGVFYRSYNIRFELSMSNRRIDTLDIRTQRELAELARVIKEDSTIKQVKVNVHLAKRQWASFYSNRLDIMYDDVIEHLVKLGVKREILSGKQYYNKCPLIDTEDIYFQPVLDFCVNNRVEFVFE